jgi:hypothetical protein
VSDFELRIRGKEPPAPLLWFALSEREQYPPELTVLLAQVVRGGELSDLVNDGPVALKLDGEVAFTGMVTEVRRVRRGVRLTVTPPTTIDARVRRTITFAPPASDPVPVFQLSGFRAAFPNVECLEQLDGAVGHLTRDNETWPRVLRRAAQLCGRAVAITHDTVRIVPPPSGTGRPIPQAARVLGADRWVLRRRAGEEMPEELDRRFVAWERLTDVGLRVGEVVTLPAGSPCPNPLRVARRVVRFSASRPGEGLTNRVQLRPAGGRPRVRGSERLKLVDAEVVHVTDSRRFGRVGVRFPWMADGCVMGEVLQPSTAAFAVPRVGDRVPVLLLPRSTSPPLVLGANFTPNRLAAAANGDDRAEWRTPEGLLVRLDRTAGEIVLAVFDKNGAIKAELALSAAGLRLKGNIEYHEGQMRFVYNPPRACP